MAKEPGRRYQTAAALAEELRRWLKGEPILARPLGQVARLWRWCKRNPRLAALSAAVIVLLLAIAVTSSTLAWQIKFEKDHTEEQRQLAENNAATARSNETLARQHEAEAERQQLIAKKNEQSAHDN
jgi:serine/threonine-protein kinase